MNKARARGAYLDFAMWVIRRDFTRQGVELPKQPELAQRAIALVNEYLGIDNPVKS